MKRKHSFSVGSERVVIESERRTNPDGSYKSQWVRINGVEYEFIHVITQADAEELAFARWAKTKSRVGKAQVDEYVARLNAVTPIIIHGFVIEYDEAPRGSVWVLRDPRTKEFWIFRTKREAVEAALLA